MTLSIEKNKQLIESEDYYILRKEGMEHVRNLSHKLWTDHNTHDPGVTILEILCYALTDLGYRTSYSIEDILAESTAGGAPDIRNFFTAREILTCNPVTMNDFRKLLIDVPGVRNAWLDFPAIVEPALYVDCNKSKLQFNTNEHTKLLELHGLYNIILELETFPELDNRDLNLFTFDVEVGPANNRFTASVVLPSWADFFNNQVHPHTLQITPLVSVEKSQQYVAQLQVNAGQADELSLPVIVQSRGKKTSAAKKFLDNKINNANGILSLYSKMIIKALKIVTLACDKLHAHRNLCEDYYEFRGIDAEEVVVCADIEVTADADIEEVLAELYHRLALYLTPDVLFYTLQEMFDKGKSSDEIFSGPILDHGFIDDNELVASNMKSEVRVSDVMQIIMDIPGVLAIRKIMLSSIYQGEVLNAGDKSVIHIGQIFRITDQTLDALRAESFAVTKITQLETLKHQVFNVEATFLIALLNLADNFSQEETLLILRYAGAQEQRSPRLNMQRSKILFYKGQIPYPALRNETERRLDELQGLERHQKLAAAEYDLEIPKGTDRNVEDYSTFQHDFPLVYKIGEEGLARSASALRRAQAKQLKAYLMFYDKVLADYLAQLAHVKDLFSMNPEIQRTYYSQPLFDLDVTGGDVPHVAPLVKDFVDTANIQNPDNHNSYAGQWETFLDDAKTDFLGAVNSIDPLMENPETFFDRKNRFLDHLMARFCEQFTDYVMLMYTLDRKRAPQELIEDKLAFLKDYPEISSDRGKAFNYLAQSNSWLSENVSGLQKRVARLLGVDSFARRSLTDFEIYLEQDQDGIDEYRFRMLDSDGKILLSSSTRYATIAEAEAEIVVVEQFGVDKANYKKDLTVAGQIYFNLCNDQNEVIARRIGDFPTEAECDAQIDRVVAFFNERPDAEGFHLLEHILLRPRSETDARFAVCTEENCDTCSGLVDPYSSRVTVVVPYWPERFDNLHFRRFFESTIRMEAPAHVHVKICWVDQAAMRRLEMPYRIWLDTMSRKDSNATIRSESQNQLLQALSTLRSVYDQVTLHDCREDDDNPVVLNHGFLGTT